MDIINDQEIASLREALRENAAGGDYYVSDLILEEDGQTYQFVDLVMEGGGTLGIALVGYIYALEQANIRFLSVGGSSVGAIVSLLLACCGKRNEEKGAALAEVISSMDMGSFIDGGPFGSLLSKLMGSKLKHKLLLGLLPGLFSSVTLLVTLGLNPGKKFLEWLTNCLSEYGVHTLADARPIIEYLPENLKHRTFGADFIRPAAELKLVTADLTTSSKVVFPEMAPLYWQNPDTINPALFARASMSIPGFFRPMTVRGVSDIVDSGEKWDTLCSFSGEIPDKITFSDGGLLSNFPISLFHQPRLPNAPTFGARLGSSSRQVTEIKSLWSYIKNLFSSLQHCNDYDFIYKNPAYRHLITYIPTHGHHWLNFYMSDAEKLSLFKNGMHAAYDFLETFDWESYKEIRREQQSLSRAALQYGSRAKRQNV